VENHKIIYQAVAFPVLVYVYNMEILFYTIFSVINPNLGGTKT